MANSSDYPSNPFPVSMPAVDIADATADDFLSGGDSNITRHESTTTTKHGAPLVFYMKKPRAAIGIKAAMGGTGAASDAMVEAIAESLCDKSGKLLFEGRQQDIPNMPLDLFQEVSSLINGKFAKDKAVAEVEGEA